MAGEAQKQRSYSLPSSACASLSDPDVKLVLHCITFSHYCERARWTLRLLGLPYEEVKYLPMAHVPGIVRLLRQFKQEPGPPTASSKSPAATPCLAIYSAAGQPLCLLQDSALICRYAVLRAAALQLPQAAQLYGLPQLALAPEADSSNNSDSTNSSSNQGGKRVTGGDPAVRDLEDRLQGTLGVEVRRVLYHALLPLPSVGGALFVNNSGGHRLLGWLVYYTCRLLLPRFLNINAATAAKGRQKLLAEFDCLDSLLLKQQQKQQQQQQAETVTAKDGAAGGGAAAAAGLPFYLFGAQMSEADIQLACLAGPLLRVPQELTATSMPPLEQLPEDLQAFIKDLRQRPTAKFVLDMWRVHGPRAGSSTGADAPQSSL